MGNLDGKVAMVTGAGQGIGRAIAEELARAGAAIAIVEINSETGSQAAAELARAGAEARYYHANVARSNDVEAAVEAAARDLGHVDILINNAGISRVGDPTHEVTDEIWNDSVGVMHSGVFYCSRAVARRLIAQGRSGSIVHISSIRGFSPNPGRIAYCSTKAAAIMMARVMAAEWGPYGIRVNAVAPGVQKTPMWEDEVRRGLYEEAAYVLPFRSAASAIPARSAGYAPFWSRRMRPTSPAPALRSMAGSPRFRQVRWR